MMEHMALSRPDISFKFVLGNQTRFHTSGNGDLREVIYRIYGREVAGALVPIQVAENGIRIEGYLGKPILVRSNRNFEIYFINGRFIKSNVVAKAIEEGYKEYLMQHKFPLCVLHITMDAAAVDVNVHPTKMDVRFSDTIGFANLLSNAVRNTLKKREMIPDAVLVDEKEERKKELEEKKEAQKVQTPEPFEKKREAAYRVMEASKYETIHTFETRKNDENKPKMQDFMQNPVWSRVLGDGKTAEKQGTEGKIAEKTTAKITPVEETITDDDFFMEAEENIEKTAEINTIPTIPRQELTMQEEPDISQSTQLNLFEDKMLTVENRSRYQIIGQVFDTYWLVQFEDKLFIIDQHAAHEKVKYERLVKQYQEKTIVSQTLMPPIIVSLTGQEESVLKQYAEQFSALGFEVEAFGGSEYALRSVPVDLYGCSEREMFLEVLDELSESGSRGNYKVVEEKIASMSCKAAVKGNNRLSRAEAEELIDELLTLENPYNCPHGRPTIISMTKSEMEKKFKRIV